MVSAASLLALFGAAATSAWGAPTPSSSLKGRDLGGKNVIVQMFEHNWASHMTTVNSVAKECTESLGPSGFGFAQVSPPSEHVLGSQWWTDYQPAGVKIIVDAVINHMTGSDRGAGTGTAGSSYNNYNYPAVPYGSNDFHSPCSINYNDANSITTCQLSSLTDLRTETDYVRGKIAGYLQDLLNLGVFGFRIDAAKHMASGDINAILGKLSRWPYVVQEVIYGAGEPVQPNQYEVNGNVNEFRATSSLRDAFVSNQGISNLLNWPFSGWVSSAKSNVFPANHDTERSDGALSYKSANNAWHNAVGTAAMSRAVAASNNRISFGRGSIAHVAINNEGSAWSTTIATDVPSGTYCNVITNCATTVTVSGGSFTATIAAYDAVAFFVGGGSSPTGGSPTATRTTTAGPTATGGSGMVSVTFQETASTEYGQGVYLVGSISQLGSWSPANSIKMTRNDTSTSKTGIWTVTLTLPASTSFQYKFVKLNNNDKSVVAWE
ncbi:hypothetical protein OIO90_003506 [Microbotryomycetes sp. JL221]|nr:hypothetical protein OIO90_003506 [Microbotryomycetes sp. JL221]